MAKTKISELTAASAIDGTELIEIVQNGINVKATTQDIANLIAAASWGSITGTLSDQTDLNSALSGKQTSDADLTTIAGLTPLNEDFLQRKSGAWANRTITQVMTDLNLSGSNTGDQTISNSSDATSHTVTLSATGGSVQLVEGPGITLTTSGTASAGVVTIASAGGAGDITNGGNTTGAVVTIGTNDAFGLNLETTGVTRMAITGGASTGGQVTITNVTTNTNTVQDALTIQTNSTGTAAASFGGALLFQGESSTTNNRDMVRLSAIWTTATDASRASALVYSDVTGAGGLTERFRFTPTSMLLATNYTFDANGNTITIGASGGPINIGSSSGAITISNTSTNNIAIHNTANTTTSTSGIVFGAATSFTQTSGTRNYITLNWNFSPTSGTAVHNQFVFSGAFNQTGGANGVTRGIYLNQTLTAVADFRAIEIAVNHASAKGVYQTGSSVVNNFVGATGFGSTSAPVKSALVEMTSTTKGFLPPRMNGTERDAISSPATGLVIYNTSTNKLNIFTGATWEALTSA